MLKNAPEFCGHDFFGPFVVAYLFAKDGVKAFCGSEQKIIQRTKDFPLCHGICHYYKNKYIDKKSWCVFGKYTTEKNFYVFLKYVSYRQKVSPYYQDLIDNTQSRYYLFLNKEEKHETIDVLASWRKLPSKYMLEFENISELINIRMAVC